MPVDPAEVALRQVNDGEISDAAATVRKALDADPGDTLLQNLAGALLLAGGDTASAEAAWKAVLAESPGDPFAEYGTGLVSLIRGDRAHAASRFAAASRSGDRACCLIAERYLEYLGGAAGTASGLTLPDSYAASARGLSGMSAAKAGDNAKALSDLGAALNQLPGDPYAEGPGLVMTFVSARPLECGVTLPSGSGLRVQPSEANRAAGRSLQGVVVLSPAGVDSDTGFVAYKVDGGSASILNTRPYKFALDTAAIPNGVHDVEIVAYDRTGRETGRAHRTFRTANAGAPRRSPEDATRAQRVQAELWRFLALRPSRHMLARSAADAARALGNEKSAEEYTEQASAIAPDDGNRQARLLALAGGGAKYALWRGAPNDPAVALTFDDGPKPGITEMLLNVLKQQGVPATFFVIGRHVTEYPALTRSIADAGMEIEDHTYTHPNLTLLSSTSVERELLRTVAAVQSATGRRMRFFRPPGGNMNGGVARVAARWGLTPVMWTVDGEALENGTCDALVSYVLKHARSGAIILLHNGRSTTVEAVPRIVVGLRQKGFGFVTINQLADRVDRLRPVASKPRRAAAR